MIRFIRVASIAPGKIGEALAFAREVAASFEKHTGMKLQIMVPVGGNPQRIAWRAEYESLGALENVQAKLLTDAKYQELIARGSDCFIAGSVFDSIWRTV
jgi:hypothetical protein